MQPLSTSKNRKPSRRTSRNGRNGKKLKRNRPLKKRRTKADSTTSTTRTTSTSAASTNSSTEAIITKSVPVLRHSTDKIPTATLSTKSSQHNADCFFVFLNKIPRFISFHFNSSQYCSLQNFISHQCR